MKLEGDLGIDTEAMGLINRRDRLCVVQISTGDGDAHLVQFEKGKYDAPNLKKLLSNPESQKIFHFARFDVAIVLQYLGVRMENIYCTKIAAKLVRTFTERHGFKDLCRELLSVEVSKQQQSSDWGAPELSPEQLEYAASDVLYLHDLRSKLNELLEREGRTKLARECFDFIPARAELDLLGWENSDLHSHSS